MVASLQEMKEFLLELDDTETGGIATCPGWNDVKWNAGSGTNLEGSNYFVFSLHKFVDSS